MLSKDEQIKLRSDLFRHLDGIATAPTAFALYEKGVLDHLLEKEKVTLAKLTEAFGASEGYLNVALRVLCSQGWLKQSIDNSSNKVTFEITINGKIAFELVPLYSDVVNLLKLSEKFHRRKFDVEPFRILERIFRKFRDNYGIEISEDEQVRTVQRQVLKHIEGNIIGPTVVALGMGGMFHKYFMEASFRADEFHNDPESFGKLLDFFTFLGWFEKRNETYRFTDKGLFFAKRASAYGVTVSYSPMFRKLDELLFGDANILWNAPEGSPEIHVDRKMNVWGSGGSHTAYFKQIDQIIIDLFNRPIEQQPKGILDMGCGNGAFLIHLFDVVWRQTERGKMLDEYPLFLVGADYNKIALNVTRANLIQADVWAKAISGDIGNPELLAKDLSEDYGIELEDLVNVRTFLDHNRVWEMPENKTVERLSQSTGAFSFRGARLRNNDVEDNLLHHFKKWMPYVKKFGLLVIELHTISPELAFQNIGKIAATAYDATHGFSDQYIVEYNVLIKTAAEAGLYPDERFSKHYPKKDFPVVSISLLRDRKISI